MRLKEKQQMPIATAIFFSVVGIIFIILGFSVDANMLIYIGAVLSVLGIIAVIVMTLFKRKKQ